VDDEGWRVEEEEERKEGDVEWKVVVCRKRTMLLTALGDWL